LKTASDNYSGNRFQTKSGNSKILIDRGLLPDTGHHDTNEKPLGGVSHRQS
jgi:hypothetical protein